MITTTATDIQNNFGKYLKAVQEGNEIIILKKGGIPQMWCLLFI